MTGNRGPVLAAVLTLLLLVGALGAVLALTTPWHPFGSGRPIIRADWAEDFTAAERAREDAFHRLVRPHAYASLLGGLAVLAVLGLTPLGARLVRLAAAPVGGRWFASVALGVVAVTLTARLATLPLDARVEAVRRRFELSTRSWGGWAADVAKGWALSTALTVIALLALYALVRAAPRWWWAPAAAGGAALVVAVSFLYPVVVEPVFNRFSSLQSGALRDSLLDLSEAEGLPVDDVLVADASRRTSSLNAYVSGFGSTRRIVVYDTLLERAAPDEIRLIVAHELGHAKQHDVLHGTLTGALAMAAGVIAVYLAVQVQPLLRRAGVESAADPRSVALVLLVVTVLTTVTGPLQMLVSRRVETRADVHALESTRDPASFVAMQRRLAVTNLSDLDPPTVVFGLFASHPTAPQRIGVARAWARLHGVPEPAPLAPKVDR